MKEAYCDLSDEELLLLAKNSDTFAAYVLYERYRQWSWTLAKNFIQTYFYKDITLEELQEEAFVSINDAVEVFDTGCGLFFPLWKKIANRKMLDYVTSNIHSKRNEFTALSLQSNNDDGTNADNLIGLEDVYIKGVIEKEDVQEIIKESEKNFSKKGKQMLLMILDGYCKEEIMEILNLSSSSYYYHFRKIKDTLTRIINS